MFLEQGRRGEPRAVLHLKAAQPGDDGRGRLGIDVAKGAASERGEAEPEDRSQVAMLKTPFVLVTFLC